MEKEIFKNTNLPLCVVQNGPIVLWEKGFNFLFNNNLILILSPLGTMCDAPFEHPYIFPISNDVFLSILAEIGQLF